MKHHWLSVHNIICTISCKNLIQYIVEITHTLLLNANLDDSLLKNCKVEMFFSYRTLSGNILKHLQILILQGNLGSGTPLSVPIDFDRFNTVPNGSGLVKSEIDTSETKYPATRSKETTLCQRLIAALVSEEGNEELCYSGSEDLDFDVYGSGVEIDTLESHGFNHRLLGNFPLAGHSGLNGYRITANERPHNELDDSFLTDVIAIPGKELISDFEYLQNGLHSDQEMSPDIPCSVTQYGNLSIDERIILEMRSVGIYLEPVVCPSLQRFFLFSIVPSFFLHLLFLHVHFVLRSCWVYVLPACFIKKIGSHEGIGSFPPF